MREISSPPNKPISDSPNNGTADHNGGKAKTRRPSEDIFGENAKGRCDEHGRQRIDVNHSSCVSASVQDDATIWTTEADRIAHKQKSLERKMPRAM